MNKAYCIHDQFEIYFLTFTITDWIDVFTRRNHCLIFLETLAFCRKFKGLKVYAYVIMTNHVHLIVNSEVGQLTSVIRDIKSYAAFRLINEITEGRESRKEWMLKRFEFAARKNKKNVKYKFWQDGYHAKQVDSENLCVGN